MKRREVQSTFLLRAAWALALCIGCGQPSIREPEALTHRPSSETLDALPPEEDHSQATLPQEVIAQPRAEVASDAGAESAPSDELAPAVPRAEARHPKDCEAVRVRIKDALRRAARCDAHDECAMERIHQAFGCSNALRKQAPLDALRAEANRYVARCKPHLGVVRCPYYTGALCTQHRCTLASPEELQAAGVAPARTGF